MFFQDMGILHLVMFYRNVPWDKGYQRDIVDVRYKKGLTCVHEFATSLSHLHEASLCVQLFKNQQ